MARRLPGIILTWLLVSGAMGPATAATHTLPEPIPEELRVPFAKAVTSLKQEKWQRALVQYDQIISRPHLGQKWARHALFGKAMVQLYLGQMGEAEEIFLRIREADDVEPRLAGKALLRLGAIKRDSGQYDEALQYLQQVYDDFPDMSGIRTMALYEIGRVYVAQGDREQFYNTIDRIQRDYPYTILSRKAVLFLIRGALELQDYERVIAVSEMLLLQLPPRDKAMEGLKGIMRVAHLALANAYAATGQQDLARKAYGNYTSFSKGSMFLPWKFLDPLALGNDAHRDQR